MPAGATSTSRACASETAPPARAWTARSTAKPKRFTGLSLYSDRAAHVAPGISPQAPQHPAVVPQRVIALRGFDDLHHARQRWITHDASERLCTDAAFRNPFVAIDARPRRRSRVVEMQTPQELEADHASEFLPHPLDVCQIVTDRMQMRRIQTETHPFPDIGRQGAAEGAQILEPRAQRRP